MAALSLAVACSSRPVTLPPPEPGPDAPVEPYTIGVRDLLRVSVWQHEAITSDVPVRPDGKISVPLAGDIMAKGLTPDQLKASITRELSKYVNSPEVSVIVLEMNSRFVSVVGRVVATARVPLTEDLRVVEAIAMAGGFDEFANRSDIRVVRRLSDGSEVEYHFDYDAYMAGRAPGTNFVLKPGDVIYVPD
jgi:polysaccharide export outer membrane protein